MTSEEFKKIINKLPVKDGQEALDILVELVTNLHQRVMLLEIKQGGRDLWNQKIFLVANGDANNDSSLKAFMSLPKWPTWNTKLEQKIETHTQGSINRGSMTTMSWENTWSDRGHDTEDQGGSMNSEEFKIVFNQLPLQDSDKSIRVLIELVSILHIRVLLLEQRR